MGIVNCSSPLGRSVAGRSGGRVTVHDCQAIWTCWDFFSSWLIGRLEENIERSEHPGEMLCLERVISMVKAEARHLADVLRVSNRSLGRGSLGRGTLGRGCSVVGRSVVGRSVVGSSSSLISSQLA